MQKRFVLALIAYGLLAAMAMATLSDQRIRGATLAVLAMFALKTWVRRKDVMHPENEHDVEAEPAGDVATMDVASNVSTGVREKLKPM